MTVIMAFDRSARTKDADGRLHVAVSNISKATVNPYRGNEVPGWQELGLDANKVYQFLRHPDELAKGAATFNNLPLLSRHVAVSASDPREGDIAGSTGTDARFEHPYLRNSLVVWRQADIDKIESEDKCELSCAYRYDPDMTPGVYEGQPYDGVMRNIRGNHVALVEAGRAGPDVMVHDEQPLTTEGRMPTLNSRKAVLVKGALISHLKPRLMAGTTLALDAALAGVTRATWRADKPKIAAAVTALATPKLAKDASLGDVSEFLGLLDGPMDEDDDEEAMDEEETEAEAEAEKLKREAKDKKAKDKKAKDKKAADKKARDAFPDRKDDDEDDDEDDKPKADDKAMDAALANFRKSLTAEFHAIAEAREVVRPYIGSVPIAMDSAADVYKLALDHAKVDLTGVDKSAYRAILTNMAKPGTKAPLAMDAAGDSLVTMFPGAARIRVS